MIIKHVFMMLRIKSNFCKIIKVILSIFTTLVLCYSIIGVLYVDYLLKPTFNLIIHEFSLSIILGLCQLNIAYVLFIVICLVKKFICIICLVRKSIDRQIQHFLVKCVKKTKNSGTNLRFRQSMPGTAAEKVSVRLTRNTILRSEHCLQ